MKTVTVSIGTDKYKTEIRTNTGHVIIADEPLDNGGQDAGCSPEELLASSLGTCTCITLRMYADRKQWPLEKVTATVHYDRNIEGQTTTLSTKLKLEGPLDEEQQRRLLAIADKCPVHQMLTQKIHMINTLE